MKSTDLSKDFINSSSEELVQKKQDYEKKKEKIQGDKEKAMDENINLDEDH
jgi:hypothetical protein